MKEIKNAFFAHIYQSQQADFTFIEKSSRQHISYELISSLICQEMASKPEGFVNEFCKGDKQFLQAMMSFLQDPDFGKDTASFVCFFLVALGYRVKMTVVITFDDKDIDNPIEEASYYFSRQCNIELVKGILLITYWQH